MSLGRTETNPAQDCRDVMDNGPGATSGKYYVKTRSSKPFQVYCDMDTDGGGWTLFLNYHWNKDDLPKDRSKEEGVPTSYLGAFVDFNPAKKGFEQKHLKQLRYLSNSGSSASPTTHIRRSVSSTSAPAASPSPKSSPPRRIRNSPKTWISTRSRTRTGPRASLMEVGSEPNYSLLRLCLNSDRWRSRSSISSSNDRKRHLRLGL